MSRHTTTYLAAALFTLSCVISATPRHLGAAERQGVTIYVSKQGDNTDGSSWQKAFHTIQRALDAVPDNRGGHKIVVRPVVRSNIFSAPPGSKLDVLISQV